MQTHAPIVYAGDLHLEAQAMYRPQHCMLETATWHRCLHALCLSVSTKLCMLGTATWRNSQVSFPCPLTCLPMCLCG
jgi:hypothetical protein